MTNLNTLASDARFYMCKEGTDEFVEINGIKEINLTEAIPEIPHEFNWCDTYSENINLSLAFPKYSRKKFKKLIMSKGMGRNMAEKVCNIIGSNHGRLSYGESMFLGLLFGGADLNHQSDKEEGK